MKVVKEETKITLKVAELKRALLFYSKVCAVEFESSGFDEAMKLAEDAVLIEDLSKAYIKLEKNIQQVAESKRVDGAISEEVMQKYVHDMEELNQQVITLDKGLTSISKEVISKIKLTPLDLLLLKNTLQVI